MKKDVDDGIYKSSDADGCLHLFLLHTVALGPLVQAMMHQQEQQMGCHISRFTW